MIYSKYVKRIVDFLIAGASLVILSPVILLVSLLILTVMGRPIFFQQLRPGYHERVFLLYKFRTMEGMLDGEGNLLSDEERLTSLGKVLRMLSIDELPELINVLKGDMSIVGPRPLLIEYLSLYNEEQHHRHDVRPGLTGLAQINGRNRIGWGEKFRWDKEYVDHISFLGDMKIIGKTFGKVIAREGISAQNKATAEPFRGNDA